MKYKVVNFHPDVKDVDGAKGAASRLETLINAQAKEGWEYYRMEGMNVEVIPTGCGGGGNNANAKTTNIQLVVFRQTS
mgnify:CR=1 FL=1